MKTAFANTKMNIKKRNAVFTNIRRPIGPLGGIQCLQSVRDIVCSVDTEYWLTLNAQHVHIMATHFFCSHARNICGHRYIHVEYIRANVDCSR